MVWKGSAMLIKGIYIAPIVAILGIFSQLFALSDNIKPVENNTTLFEFLKIEDEKSAIEYLRQHLFLLNMYDVNHRSSLHYAILFKKYNILRYLLDNGVKTYTQDGGGDTPLHLAVKNRDFYAIRLLMQKPETIKALYITNAQGLTPEAIAKKRGYKKIYRYLHSFVVDDSDYDAVFEELDSELEERPKKRKSYKNLQEKKKKTITIKHSHLKSQTTIKNSTNTGNAKIKLEH